MPRSKLNPNQVNEDTLQDADNDTKVQVEESADEDKIRFDTAGTERMIVGSIGRVGIGTSAPQIALDVHQDPTLLGNDTGGGDVARFGSGTLTAGKIYYLNSSGAWTETDANAVATSDGLLGIALGSSPSSDGVLLRGFFDAASYLSNFVAGKPVYLSTTAASIDTVQPSGAGDIVRCVGYCTTTANVIYFCPDSTFLELS